MVGGMKTTYFVIRFVDRSPNITVIRDVSHTPVVRRRG